MSDVMAGRASAPVEGASEGAETSRRPRDRTVLSSPRIHRMQAWHFALFDAAPLLGAVAVLATLPLRPPSALDLALFFAAWLASGLGLTVGFHRLFSHRAFECGPGVAVSLLILGAAAARGPMFSWAAMHRRHHERSDRAGDLHSPHRKGGGRLGGWLHAHFTWMIRHDYPNVAYYVPDLLQQPLLVRWNARYYACVAGGLAAPALVAGLATASWSGAFYGFVWGGVMRLFVVEQTMNAINSLHHMIGARPFPGQPDDSRNIGWAAALTWGEGWHNNHHAFPWSAAFGLSARQIDPGFWLIRLLERMGLAWRVRTPDARRIAARLAAAEPSE